MTHGLTIRLQIHTLSDNSEVVDVILKDEDKNTVRIRSTTPDAADELARNLRALLLAQSVESVRYHAT